MRILIFDSELSGHHLEYLHHIYEEAIKHEQHTFVFAVPKEQYTNLKDQLIWKESTNLEWYFLDDNKCSNIYLGSKLNRSLKLSLFIKETVNKTKTKDILLINFAPCIPFLPLILSKKNKISGIIYKVFLRSKLRRLPLIVNYIRYGLMAYCTNIKTVWLLNDKHSANKLNQYYRVKKFSSICDPIPYFDTFQEKNFRIKYDIEDNEKVFLHFGGMSRRKGTLEILRSLLLMNSDEFNNACFIFVGRVYEDIKIDFYDLLYKLQEKGCHIIVIDRFVSYSDLHNFCKCANCILIPYLQTDLSSGVLGYSSLHKVPVLGPKAGLIGELIQKYKLGTVIPAITPESILEGIRNFNYREVESDYGINSSIQDFVKEFLKGY